MGKLDANAVIRARIDQNVMLSRIARASSARSFQYSAVYLDISNLPLPPEFGRKTRARLLQGGLQLSRVFNR
jgi:hypothetical protein